MFLSAVALDYRMQRSLRFRPSDLARGRSPYVFVVSWFESDFLSASERHRGSQLNLFPVDLEKRYLAAAPETIRAPVFQELLMDQLMF